MLNVLFPNISWAEIECVGFDLDGTLYDEFEFINQVYSKIIMEGKNYFEKKDGPRVLEFMKRRWLAEGSSYNRIFEETFDKFANYCPESKRDFVSHAITIFRNFCPKLSLPARNELILSHMREKYEMFLVTDGNPVLQSRKLSSLGIEKYFHKNSMFITSLFGAEFEKPSIKIMKHIDIPSGYDKVVFIGDRDQDRFFAKSAGFQFLKVYNLTCSG